VQSVSTHQYVSYSTMQNYAYGGYSVLTGLAHARYCSVYPTYIQKWLNFDPQPADNDIVPNFAANVTSGTAPLAVKFTDSSSGTGLFAWNLSTGDGTWYNTTSISQKSPTHTYTAAGTYDVTEYVYGSGGYSFVKKFDYITVGAGTLPPTASFSANATDGDEPLAVQFYDTSTGSPTSWLWQFGDGNTSSARHPVHTYVQAGIYTVNLRATNAGGSSWSNVTQYITVTQAASTAPPIISGNATPDSGEAPLSVQFVGTGENVEDWLWDFDDGTTSDDQNVTHIYYAAGTYDVVLSVTNASGANETTIPVTVTGPPIPALPHANFTANVTDGPIPLAVAFAFTGDCLDPIYMNYNFGDGSAVAWGQDVTHTYTEAGTYTVTLTIGNASGGSVMRKTGYIAASDPADWLDADFVANKTFCRLPNCIVGFMDSSTGPVTNYSWTFGDGGTSDEMNPVHTYRFAGWYTVNLTVSIYGDPSDYERKTRYVLVQVPGGGWWY
jgi:PKD repeat protein